MSLFTHTIFFKGVLTFLGRSGSRMSLPPEEEKDGKERLCVFSGVSMGGGVVTGTVEVLFGRLAPFSY